VGWKFSIWANKIFENLSKRNAASNMSSYNKSGPPQRFGPKPVNQLGHPGAAPFGFAPFDKLRIYDRTSEIVDQAKPGQLPTATPLPVATPL
jgi:hypothetical protein